MEAIWSGAVLSRATLFAERRGPLVRLRAASGGSWHEKMEALSPIDSMVTHVANPEDGSELLAMRERMRNRRFYDALRTDPGAPARRPQVMTFAPVLASDGADLAVAVLTIRSIGR